jgi:hypothetical protein
MSKKVASVTRVDVTSTTSTTHVAKPTPKPKPQRRGPVEVVISFDTTGSMYGYLAEVRKNLRGLIDTLRTRVPGIRIGVIAHGDYCDAGATYVIKFLPLITDYAKLSAFVAEVGQTGGGDAPECYELALNKANKAMGWSKGAHSKAMVLVGDDLPHEPGYACNGGTVKIDWRCELAGLVAKRVQIYAVHAGGRTSTRSFYDRLASESQGRYLGIGDMSEMRDVVVGVCLHHASDDAGLDQCAAEARRAGRMGAVQLLEEIRRTVVITIDDGNGRVTRVTHETHTAGCSGMAAIAGGGGRPQLANGARAPLRLTNGGTNAGGDPRPRILQLVQAHERSTGAHMPAAAIPPAYQSAFGEPLPLREGQKLRDLLKAVRGIVAYQPPGKPHWMVMAC